MPDTPLNPDALEAGAKAIYNEEPWQKSTYSVESHSWDEIQEEDRQAFREEAKIVISPYLAVAQPVVNSVEELDDLPHGVIILDADDDPMMLSPDGEGGADWVRFYDPGWYNANAVELPACVLYRPEVKP